MKKLILLSLLLFIGCEETLEPEDCAGVAGGTAVEDNCGTCDSDLTNDNTTCIQDGCGAWGGNGFNSQGYYCTDINILRDIIQSSDWESAGEQTWNNIVDLSDSPMKRLIQFKINQSNVIIPDNIGGLSEITQFWIYNCNLNNIPYEIGNLNKLIDLGLMYNNLSGNILASLGNIKTLEILDLTGNQFTGTIPDTIYTLSNLKDLWLPYNDLSGEISEQIENLDNLKEIWFSDNNFSGNIPNSLWNIISLTGIWLDYNNLEGNIPNEIGNLSQLKHLHLSNNSFSGIIPNEICELSLPYANLDSLYLWQWDQTYWKYFDISNNQFCPPYPSCIEDYVGEQDTSECGYCIDNPTDPLCN